MSPDPILNPEEEEGDLTVYAPVLWRAALEELEMQMTKATFTNWLQGTTAAWVAGDLVIYCRNEYALAWLESRLRDVIERTVASAAGAPYPIRFEVAG